MYMFFTSCHHNCVIMWVLYLDLLCDSELFMLNIIHFNHQNVGGGHRLELWTQVCF